MSQVILNWINSLVAGTTLDNKYIVSLLIVVAVAVLGKLVLFIFSQYLELFASKTKNNRASNKAGHKSESRISARHARR